LFDRFGKRLADQFTYRPDMIRDPDRHSRSDPQGFVDAAQIEVSDI
jgi:hypothetical protein